MKKTRRLAWVLMALALAFPCGLMPLMPERVPVHYGITGAPDSFGSPWMYLALPLISAALGLAMLLAAPRQQAGPGERVMTWAAVYFQLIFGVLNGLLMWKARSYDPAAEAGWDVGKLVTICLGALLIVMGNIMPKARRNGSFGLRNRWSAASDRVWQKCQRLGGYLMAGTGVVLLLAAVFLRGLALFIALLGLLAAMIAVSTVLCRRVYRAETEGGRT